jgi:uncharacterized membrane protein YeaQ/YmgE (transglycosylase-associated protein family)
MYLSNQSLLVVIVVGIVAGWLAGRVMEGGGFGLIGDLIVGLIGAFIGDWLLPRLGIHLVQAKNRQAYIAPAFRPRRKPLVIDGLAPGSCNA